MFVKNILSAWSIILIDGLLLFDYREKYSFSSAWSEMMIDGSQVAALRVVDSAWSFQHNLAANHGQGRDLLGPVRNTNWVETRLSWVTTSQQNHFIIGIICKKLLKTRSSWLNCALRDDEAVYWVSIGRYEAVAVSNWWYRVSWGHSCLYILQKVEIWTGVTDAWLTDWLTDNFER